MTNQEMWDAGTEKTTWSCDINPITGEVESNGGVEHLMDYEGHQYLIITDWSNEIVYHPYEECKRLVEENELLSEHLGF